MALTRLSQIALGEQAYEADEIEVGPALWGWTAYRPTVIFDEPQVTRLGQIGIGVADYFEETGESIEVGLTTGNWGWTAYPVDLPAITVITTTGNWGWTPQGATLCSQYDVGYAGSFNSNVWPTCVWNDFVFGPREAHEISLDANAWGWTAQPADVVYFDPILVDLQTGNWGWTAQPASISFAFDVQMAVWNWGWTAYPATVSLPYNVSLSVGNWGWAAVNVAVSFENDVNLTSASYGWQALPADVQTPSLDVNLRLGNWGWTAYPATVRQTTLLPDDFEAIAEAVYAKLVQEGAVQQWLETWQRQGSDANNPQTYPPQPGGNIEVGGQQILTEQLPDGSIRHTRQ